MGLATYIEQNIEPILQAWEDFARSLPTPGKPLDPQSLRDHAGLMLHAITEDLRVHQSRQEQIDKSQGNAPARHTQSAAETHAVTRLMAGFTLDQMVSEYRALRASVLRLWLIDIKGGSDFEIEDMTRFNEAIDQALTESIASYSRAVDASRNIFLGILGHDLRTPLGAIQLGADMLLRTSELGVRPTKISAQIYTSVQRANKIVADLLDFTRSQLGPGIPVTLKPADLAHTCNAIVNEARAYHIDAKLVYEACPAARGTFDSARMEQVFSNLISNAVLHGDPNLPIKITLATTPDTVTFSVHNWGQPVPESALPFLFNPMGRFSQHAEQDQGPTGGMGLGLYIASQIITAHGGNIEVTSTADQGTSFVIHVPVAGNSEE